MLKDSVFLAHNLTFGVEDDLRPSGSGGDIILLTTLMSVWNCMNVLDWKGNLLFLLKIVFYTHCGFDFYANFVTNVMARYVTGTMS